MSQKKRLYPRVPLNGNAIIYLGNSRLMCKTINVAVGGMALSCPFPWEPGTFLQVDFTLPNVPRWISAKAVLVRNQEVEDGRVWGLKFKTLHQKVASLIATYVEAQL